jgi:hypothetical protein
MVCPNVGYFKSSLSLAAVVPATTKLWFPPTGSDVCGVKCLRHSDIHFSLPSAERLQLSGMR